MGMGSSVIIRFTRDRRCVADSSRNRATGGLGLAAEYANRPVMASVVSRTGFEPVFESRSRFRQRHRVFVQQHACNEATIALAVRPRAGTVCCRPGTHARRYMRLARE